MTELETNRLARAALIVSGGYIKELPVFQRVGWILYLLEILDDGQDDYEQILTDVKESIETRLAEGEW